MVDVTVYNQCITFLPPTQSGCTHPGTCCVGDGSCDQQKLLRRRLLTLVGSDKDAAWMRQQDKGLVWLSKWTVEVQMTSLRSTLPFSLLTTTTTITTITITITDTFGSCYLLWWSVSVVVVEASSITLQQKLQQCVYIINMHQVSHDMSTWRQRTCQNTAGLTLLCGRKLATTWGKKKQNIIPLSSATVSWDLLWRGERCTRGADSGSNAWKKTEERSITSTPGTPGWLFAGNYCKLYRTWRTENERKHRARISVDGRLRTQSAVLL